jgi:hypothetical protein
MTEKKIIQYLYLSLIGILLTYRLIPFGDYCSKGLVNGLSVIFFGGIFIISFIIICTINIYKKIKNKQSFDFIPVLIFLIFWMIFYGLVKLDYTKFWTKDILIGTISNIDRPTNAELKLYENKTFDATVNYVDFSCTYVGNYEIQNDRLKLLRNDLAEETQNFFTTEYIILTKEKLIKPIDTTFSTIKILENK